MNADMSTLIQRYTGALLALIAAFAFTLMDALAQNCMRHGLSPGQVAFGRMVSCHIRSFEYHADDPS